MPNDNMDPQWLTRRELRTSARNLRAEALAETDRINNPSDDRDAAEFEQRHPIVGILN